MTAAEPARPRGGRIVTAVVVLGIALIAALPAAVIGAALHTRHITSAIKGGVTTTGTITSVESQAELHGRSYTPTIAFTDRDGHVHLFSGPSDATSQKIGTRVTVSYDPADPEHAADVSAGSTTWKITLGVGVALAAAEVVGAGWVIRQRRVARRAAATTSPDAGSR
jgi:hypothetical protein